MSTVDPLVAAAVSRISAASGVALTPTVVARHGYQSSGFRIASLEMGRGLEFLLSHTMHNAEALFLPEDSAGALVRAIGSNLQDDPSEWLAQLDEGRRRGVRVTVRVNEETLEDPADIPQGSEVWRSIDVECLARGDHRSEADILNSYAELGGYCLALVLAALTPDMQSIQASEGLPEGARVTVEANRYERSPANRLACINHYGASCWACDLDFQHAYGDIGAGFIEVHHRVPVSQLGDGYRVDPVRDLVPLCSNCHSMAHRSDPPYTPMQLREFLGKPPREPLPDVSGTPADSTS